MPDKKIRADSYWVLFLAAGQNLFYYTVDNTINNTVNHIGLITLGQYMIKQISHNKVCNKTCDKSCDKFCNKTYSRTHNKKPGLLQGESVLEDGKETEVLSRNVKEKKRKMLKEEKEVRKRMEL